MLLFEQIAYSRTRTCSLRVRVVCLTQLSSHRGICHASRCCSLVKNRYVRREPGQQVVSAQNGPTSRESTIKSLDSILGSRDDQVEAEITNGRGLTGANGTLAEGGAGGSTIQGKKREPDAAARRVRPLYVYVIYYCFIVVYLATAWLQATEGDLAASALVDGLVNDHLAVATGQVPRLATAGFVCETPIELFLQLATLLTVGAEAEALLGYSLFWAVYWLANLGGGLADAAFSELPVTYGPANAAAGVVGALVAYYARNLGLEQRLDAARIAARNRRRRQLVVGAGSRGRDGMRVQEEDSAAPEEEVDAEVEVEVLPLLPLTFSGRMSVEGRGVLSVLVALVMAGQGLIDFGGASSSASWIGLTAAFSTGLVLTFGAGPQYEVQYEEPRLSSDMSRESSSVSASTSSADCTSAAKEGEANGSESHRPLGGPAQERPPADSDGLWVVDVCPPTQRPLVLGAYTAGLAVIILGWLAWMGTDI